jgi:hypothetical protein
MFNSGQPRDLQLMVTAKAAAARVSSENTIPMIPVVGRVHENAAHTSHHVIHVTNRLQ